VEHMTSLEYYNNDWHLYTHEQEEVKQETLKSPKPRPEVLTNEIAIYLHSLTQPSAI